MRDSQIGTRQDFKRICFTFFREGEGEEIEVRLSDTTQDTGTPGSGNGATEEDKRAGNKGQVSHCPGFTLSTFRKMTCLHWVKD